MNAYSHGAGAPDTDQSPSRRPLIITLIAILVVLVLAGIAAFAIWRSSGQSQAEELKPVYPIDISSLGENPHFAPLTSEAMVDEREDYTLARATDDLGSYLVGMRDEASDEQLFSVELPDDDPCVVTNGTYRCGSVAFDPETLEAAEVAEADDSDVAGGSESTAEIPAGRQNTQNEELVNQMSEAVDHTFAGDKVTSLEVGDAVVVADGDMLAGRSGDQEPWSVELEDEAAEQNSLGEALTRMVLGHEHLIVSNGDQVLLIDPTTGEPLWEICSSLDSWVSDNESIYVQHGTVIDIYEQPGSSSAPAGAAAPQEDEPAEEEHPQTQAAQAYREILDDPEQHLESALPAANYGWVTRHALVELTADAEEAGGVPHLMVSFRDESTGEGEPDFMRNSAPLNTFEEYVQIFAFDADAGSAVPVGEPIHLSAKLSLSHDYVVRHDHLLRAQDDEGFYLVQDSDDDPHQVTFLHYTLAGGELSSETLGGLDDWDARAAFRESKTGPINWFALEDTPMVDLLEAAEWVGPHGPDPEQRTANDRALGLHELEGVVKHFTAEEHLADAGIGYPNDPSYLPEEPDMVVLKLAPGQTIGAQSGDGMGMYLSDAVDYLLLGDPQTAQEWLQYDGENIRFVYHPTYGIFATDTSLPLGGVSMTGEVVEVME